MDGQQEKQYGRIDLARQKELHIYLKLINTATNYVDGAASKLLAFIFSCRLNRLEKKMLLADLNLQSSRRL